MKVGDLIDLCTLICKKKMKPAIFNYHLENDFNLEESYRKHDSLKKDKEYVCKVISCEIEAFKNPEKKWSLLCLIEGRSFYIYINNPTRDFFVPSWEIAGKSFYVTFLDDVDPYEPYFGEMDDIVSFDT